MREVFQIIMTSSLLTWIIFLPLLGVLALFFIKDENQIRWTALIVLVVDFLLTIPMMLGFDKSYSGMQFVEKHTWIDYFNINYYLGVDGISVLFVFLTALIGWVCVLASWRSIQKKVKEFMIAILVMQCAMLGVFCALDLILFFVFWETMLIPMYLIIGVWGGPKRIYAAFKFFIYTMAGSIFMLVAIITIYFKGGGGFDIPYLMSSAQFGFGLQCFLFVCFYLAFAVKVPMFPFHTWLPDAHVQAPTAGSIILAGVLLKVGTYGFLRFSMPMFPDASQYFAMPIIILSLIAIIYGAYLALAQEDLKKLIAYSSVSHMGFITLGLFLFNKDGVEGAILQMFNHGITTSALFLCVGVIYERTHSRNISDYGWGARVAPWFTMYLFIFSLASLGFPGTNGFIGEILILFGAYEVAGWLLVPSLIGIVLGAAYMLWVFQRIAYGKFEAEGFGTCKPYEKETGVWDLVPRETFLMIVFTFFVLWVGFQPMDFLSYMHESVAVLLNDVNSIEAVIDVTEAVSSDAVSAVTETAVEAAQ